MKQQKAIWLAAGLIGGALALTGCAAQTAPAATPTPDTAQKITAQPQGMQEASPEPSAEAAEETPGPLTLEVEGKHLQSGAINEKDKLLLPLIETAQALGWEAKEEETQEETQTKRSVTLSKDDSVVSVSWISKDNTASKITWQKDGLLIPVNALLTTVNEIVYVPAAFFEEAMDVQVTQEQDAVKLSMPQEQTTPDTQLQP